VRSNRAALLQRVARLAGKGEAVGEHGRDELGHVIGQDEIQRSGMDTIPDLLRLAPGMDVAQISANRWAVKPQLGVSYPTGAWFIEGYAGVWLFTDNSNYYGGARREQEPVGTLQSHISYTFRPRLWLAFDLTYYAGGRTAVNGVYNDDRQSNSRVGLTLSLPAGGRQSVKLTWSRGATVRVGGDFTTVGATWQYSWFD